MDKVELRRRFAAVIMQDTLAPGTKVQGAAEIYTVLNLVGRGGMGVVDHVTRSSDGSTWALTV
jgi:hypothetical protein